MLFFINSYIYLYIAVSKKEEAVANELRELLREAANNRPPIKPRPTLSDTSSATSSVGKKTTPKVAITKVLTNGGMFVLSIYLSIYLSILLIRYTRW